MDIWGILLVLGGILVALFLWGQWEDGYFRRRGIKSTPAPIPFLGHMWKVFLQKEHIIDLAQRIYKAFPGEKYVGMRQFTKSLIAITDVELLKQLAIKDFDHFLDHTRNLNDNEEDIFSRNLFVLKGQRWRDMRAILSPAFTSSKMRAMFQFVAETGEQMTDYYTDQMHKSENKVRGLVEVEMKDAFTRYANDVIATTAFGIRVDSLKEPNNEFYLMGKSAANFTGIKMLRALIISMCTSLNRLLRLTFLDKKTSAFYRSLVLDSMKYREENNITRPDMIQLLMEAKKGSLKHETSHHEDMKDAGFATVEESALGKKTVTRELSDTDIVAQAVLFFIAGFETSSTLLCFIAHALTIYPNIQKKLQEEIDGVASKNSGKVTYNDLQSMKYLDMVVSETLRYWPPATATDRECVKPYTLPPPNDSSKQGYQFKAGNGIWIPIYSFHHDPKYFKDPEVFDPERFSEENKGNIVPFSYIPFGIGPRNCIGSRFALMEAKAVIFHLLYKFDFVQTAKTQHPIKLNKNTFNLHAENGFWIGMKPRYVVK